MNSLGRVGVQAGFGRIPGTSRVTNVDFSGRYTSSGSQRRRSGLPQILNRAIKKAQRFSLISADLVQWDDLGRARRKMIAAQRECSTIQLYNAVVVELHHGRELRS